MPPRRLSGHLASGRLPRERWIIDEERWNLDSLFDRLKRELVKAGTIRAGLTFHGLRKSLSKKAALPRTKKPKCFGNTAAPVPLLRSLHRWRIGNRNPTFSVF